MVSRRPESTPTFGRQPSSLRARAAETRCSWISLRAAQDDRLQVGVHKRQDPAHDLDDGQPGDGGEIEGRARDLGPVPHGICQRQDPGRGVSHVQVVAHEGPVGADHRALAAEHRADRAGDDPAPVQVAAAVEVAAARDRDRQPVRVGIRLSQKVGRGLGGVVGVMGPERHLLSVGPAGGISVRLVGGGDHDAPDRGCAAARLERGPGPGDVVVEGLDRVHDRRAHQRLGRQVDDRLDPLSLEDPADQARIPHVAVDRQQAGRWAVRALARPGDVEPDDVRSRPGEALGHPRPQEACGSGDQDAGAAPVLRRFGRHAQVTQGARFSPTGPGDSARRGACPWIARSRHADRPSAGAPGIDARGHPPRGWRHRRRCDPGPRARGP